MFFVTYLSYLSTEVLVLKIITQRNVVLRVKVKCNIFKKIIKIKAIKFG